MKHGDPKLLPLYAFIAKRWLRSSYLDDKKELIATKRFILKAERLYTHSVASSDIISTFSIHIKDTSGNKPCWRYRKYRVDHNGSYNLIREGKYPYDWE